MSYVKRWVPPTNPIPNNLAAWKSLFGDLHQNLIDSGFVQTDAAGQLDINSVAALPSRNTWAGFIDYELDDDLRSVAAIGLRLEFGSGVEGLNRYVSGPSDRDSRRDMAPFIRAKVKFKGTQESEYFGYPQSFFNTSSNYTNTSATATAGRSFICNSPSRGFFGIAYGVGSRNNPFNTSGNSLSSAIGTYIGSTFTLFIQRTISEDGEPNGDGIGFYYGGLDIEYAGAASQMAVNPRNGGNNWNSGKNDIAYSDFLPNHATSKSRFYAAIIGNVPAVRTAGESGALDRVYFSSPILTAHRYIYTTHKDAITEFSEISVDIDGELLNFVSLGNCTSVIVDEHTNNNSTILMLLDEG